MTIQEELDLKKIQYAKLCQQIADIDAGPVRVELKRIRNGLTGEMVNLRQKLVQEQIDIALAGGTPKHIPTLSFGK